MVAAVRSGAVNGGCSPKPRGSGASICGLALLCSLAHAATAFAHAAPEVLRIVWPESGPGVLLFSNRGLIFRDTENGPWRLMCNEALKVGVGDPLELLYLADGRLWVGSRVGLWQTNDDGCTWQGVDPLGSAWIQSLQHDPKQHSRIYVALYGKGIGGVRVTEDAGLTWSVVTAVADSDFISGIRIAPEKPEQLYLWGTTFGSGGNMYYVARSNDRGVNWERSELSVGAQEVDPKLFAVSPRDPLVLLAKASAAEPGMDPERLLVSRDGGKSFTSPLTIMSLRDAAFSADGATAWVVGKGGLWRSTDDLQSFGQVSGPEYMTSIVEHGGVLYGAGYYDGLAAVLDGIGTSGDSGDSFKQWMQFKDVADPVACSADSATLSACQMPNIDWQRERSLFGNGSDTVLPVADAGIDSGTIAGGDAAAAARDAGLRAGHSDAGKMTGKDAGSAATAHPRLRGGGCTCSALGLGGARSISPLLLLALALAAVRIRSKPVGSRTHTDHS
jgi:hypothetical protein